MELPKRKAIRLKEYDYSQNGAYFVTICTNNKKQILGYIHRDDPCGHPWIKLSQLGEIWQRSFYDHVIRNKDEYQKIWEYIDTNPLRWELDCHHVKSE